MWLHGRWCTSACSQHATIRHRARFNRDVTTEVRRLTIHSFPQYVQRGHMQVHRTCRVTQPRRQDACVRWIWCPVYKTIRQTSRNKGLKGFLHVALSLTWWCDDITVPAVIWRRLLVADTLNVLETNLEKKIDWSRQELFFQNKPKNKPLPKSISVNLQEHCLGDTLVVCCIS